jgi:hypothetical protein
MKRHKDDDVIHVYQEEIEGHKSFTVSDGAGLTELATHDVHQRNAFGTPLVCSDLCTLGKSLSHEASFRSGCCLRTLQEVRVAGSCVR